jgi:hypothetical protein
MENKLGVKEVMYLLMRQLNSETKTTIEASAVTHL